MRADTRWRAGIAVAALTWALPLLAASAADDPGSSREAAGKGRAPAPAGERRGLWAVSVAHGQMRQISTPEADAVGDSAVSPTRDLIAYIAATTTGPSQQRLAFVDSLGRAGGATSPHSVA